SITGGISGIIIGYTISRYFGKAGIDLYFWKEAYAEFGYSSLVYPVIDSKTLIITAIMVIITGVLSAIYPAYKALKLNPSEAIRTQ
ncbi:MAG: FtsX-like permease family protein, partial [Bacteroidota bacterium]|nr:FtsX-like permease family protein [Bacteroidota bacterium]